jgi:hypothetical protein
MRPQVAALTVCAGMGAFFCTIVLADKTVVTVEKGQVRAETTAGTVTLAAGQKAVLSADKKPLAGVNDPMVDDLIALSKWIDTERESKRIQIDSASIQIVAIESDKRFKTASLFEAVNQAQKPLTTDRIGNISGAVEPRFYDMQGRLLEYDAKKTGQDSATYDIRFRDPVPPGARYEYVGVSDVNAPRQCLSSDGKVWRVWISNGSPNCLNYFRFILPKSAILIETSSRPVLVDDSRGRVAVTLRNYTGEDTGAEHLLFLWPERDGTSLADIPPEYRGGPDAWKAGLREQYSREMARIRASQDYNDQSTPLATLLTRNAAMIRGDRQRLLALTYLPDDPQREAARKEMEKLEAALGGLQGVRELIVDTVEVVSGPPWPKNPREGATYEMDTYGKGGQTRNWTIGFVFHDGKWCLEFGRPGPGLPTDDVWLKEHPKPRPASGADAERSAALTREYQAQMERIRKGDDYNDQRTPLATLLTRNAAIIRGDRERLIATACARNEPRREAVRKEIEEMEKELGGMEAVRALVVDPVEVISTPQWPEKPQEEAYHRIDMYGKDLAKSSLPVFTMILRFHEGKWYVDANSPGPGHPKSQEKP